MFCLHARNRVLDIGDSVPSRDGMNWRCILLEKAVGIFSCHFTSGVLIEFLGLLAINFIHLLWSNTWPSFLGSKGMLIKYLLLLDFNLFQLVKIYVQI